MCLTSPGHAHDAVLEPLLSINPVSSNLRMTFETQEWVTPIVLAIVIFLAPLAYMSMIRFRSQANKGRPKTDF